jgi:UDP-N-acetylglucosamine--N-acetylmuramyl-(pentapeptide) pyrophosphoryl-undecaprenol N-acetylglucosamine transferase
MAALRVSRSGFSVCHLTGQDDPLAVRQAYAAAGIDARVEPFAYDMREIYAASDFAIACPGAITLAELAAWGLPALLVPRASVAANHQLANARAYAARTGAEVVTESEWDLDREARRLDRLLSDPARLTASGRQALAFATPNAAHAVVHACESVFERPLRYTVQQP